MSVISVRKNKGKSVTLQQKEALVEFLEINPDLKKGKFTSSFTHKRAQSLWEQISQHLNAMIGAKKIADKWRKCWTDMKCNAKTKSVELKKNLQKTGGGKNERDNVLAPIDEKIVGIIGDVPIYGHPHTIEPSISFEGYHIVLDSSNNINSKPLVEVAYENNYNDIPSETSEIQFTPNELPSTDMEISEETDIIGKNYTNSAKTVKLTSRKGKLDVFQKSVNASLQVSNISEERNKILKDYYSKKLQLLERIAVAKEKKVALMEAKYNMLGICKNSSK